MRFWNICKERNNARFESSDMKHSVIIENIRMQIYQLYTGFGLELMRGKTPEEPLHFFKLTTIQKESSFQVIMWKRPPLFWSKIIVDGASMGNPGDAGYGGIIRNSSSTLILGFGS